MRTASYIIISFVLSLALFSCGSSPKQEPVEAVPAEDGMNGGTEKNREFDPCLINPNLAVCKQ